MWIPFAGAAATPKGQCCYFPVFQGFNADKVTAAFTGFTPPAGFDTWDTAGGETPTPGPTIGLEINVANAPEWQGTHVYGLKDRVLAGGGWSGSAYTNGQPVCLFAVTVAGTSGSSASAFNTACASGTPAGVGGGLDGTIPAGWAGATTVSDGGVTWALLSRIDYPTITAMGGDDPDNWATSTGYGNYEVVINGGNAYQNVSWNFSPFPNTPAPICTSSGDSGRPDRDRVQHR